MNIQEYIESGKLESYLLNLLSEAERREVEYMVNQYPEIRQAMNALEDDLASFALSKAPPLPDTLQASILAKIDSLDNEKGNSSGKNWSPGLIAALVLALLASAVCFYLFQQKGQVEESLQIAQNDLNELQIACDTQRVELENAREQLNILRNPSYRSTIMNGTDNLPQAVAAVFFNPDDSKSYLDIRNLPEPPSGSQYQLWAIVNGEPTDMGVFDLTADGDLQEVPFIADAQAYAVTIEPEGGSAVPTLSNMVMIGNV